MKNVISENDQISCVLGSIESQCGEIFMSLADENLVVMEFYGNLVKTHCVSHKQFSYIVDGEERTGERYFFKKKINPNFTPLQIENGDYKNG